MTFKQAVEAIPHLGAAAFRRGIQALTAADRARIECANSRALSGSVNIDVSLQPAFPNDPRWDYAIGYRRGRETLFWVEVHPASQGDVAEVQNKFTWLKGWLTDDGETLRQFEAQFIWISSGRTTFTQSSPTLRRLAQQGVRAVGRVLRIG